MKTLTIRTGESVADFFRHGRELARLADQQLPLPEEYVISFEDPADLLALLNTDRLAVLWAIKIKQARSPPSRNDFSADAAW